MIPQYCELSCETYQFLHKQAMFQVPQKVQPLRYRFLVNWMARPALQDSVDNPQKPTSSSSDRKHPRKSGTTPIPPPIEDLVDGDCEVPSPAASASTSLWSRFFVAVGLSGLHPHQRSKFLLPNGVQGKLEIREVTMTQATILTCLVLPSESSKLRILQKQKSRHPKNVNFYKHNFDPFTSRLLS
ncbi:hypothetical protein BJ165DRAFT_683408 [Panaeolus papilionaceus]|nr:hypothetical protein BJ165DRAFT_683408 [Panaeolus papilionaceus]